MFARPRARSARTARTPRNTPHRIPIGLQIAIRIFDHCDTDGATLHDDLRATDMRTAAILNNPLVTLYDEGPNDDLEALAKRFGVAEAAARIANAIPKAQRTTRRRG